jgi:hypothetical protein
MATTKKKAATEEKDEVEVFEAVAKSVPRTLTHPETGEEREFSQHELAFIPKTKFFRLVSGTLRLAADEGDGVNNLISDVINDVSGVSNDQMILGVMRLVELSPDFLEEAFLYALNVKPKDREWAYTALESLDDEEGLDIIEVFVAQNGDAIKDFLPKLQKIGKRVQKVIQTEDTEQE